MIAALALVALLPQERGEESKFLFKKGTVWVYDRILTVRERGRAIRPQATRTPDTMRFEVVEVDGGRMTIDVTLTPDDDTRKVEKSRRIWTVKDGYFRESYFWEGMEGTPTALYKLSSRKDRGWDAGGGFIPPTEANPERSGSGSEVMWHVGTDDVSVPAGRFRQAIHVVMGTLCLCAARHHTVGSFFIVPGTGFVKWVLRREREKTVETLELREFRPAK